MSNNRLMPRDEAAVIALTTRLNRIIGQINGVKKMIEQNKYCKDVLQQITAADKALQSFAYLVLEEHLRSCVSEKIKADDPDIIEETMEIIRRIN